MVRLHPVERAMLDALGSAASTHEPALSAVSRALARAAPSAGEFPAGLVSGLLAWFGLPDPPPSVFVVEVDDPSCVTSPGQAHCEETVRALASEALGAMPPGTAGRFGVGADLTDQGHTRMIVTVLERAAELEPLPRAVPIGGRVRVRGQLLGQRRMPRIELVDAEGRQRDVPAVLGSDGSFDATFACGAVGGTVMVEVLCEGEHGVEVAANFPVQCGGAVPDQIAYVRERIGPGVSSREVARRLFALVNEVRVERGLTPLEWSDVAAQVAGDHAEDMVETRFVGHVSPTTGSAIDRFARARIDGVVIRENVARGYGPYEIHASLMDSPGHRANILADDVTHVGIGVVLGAPETSAEIAPIPIYVTQNFYLDTNSEAPPELTLGLLERVRDRRLARGRRDLPLSEGLGEIAVDVAGQIASGRTLDRGFEQAAFELGFAEVELHRAFATDFRSLASVDLFDGPAETGQAWGVSVRRVAAGPHAGEFALVVLRGRR